MAKVRDWQSIAHRRAQFLINEARSSDPTYDQTVRYALRVISNWATVGKDCSSAEIKWLNPRVSEKALELYDAVSDEEWLKRTTNEHPEPISVVWQWICEQGDHITPEAILARAKQWPMVTVTLEEDRLLTTNGLRSSGKPEDRHRDIVLASITSPPKKRRAPKTPATGIEVGK